jgi:general secretion pathway protein L
MSLLIVFAPPRVRRAPDAASLHADGEWDWALSADGRSVAAQGRSTPRSWPRATRTAVVVDDADVAWHRTTLPRAPAARMPQALLGVLEEQLLDDDAQLHFALPAAARPGEPAWVAVLHRPWLAKLLAAIEQDGRAVDMLTAAPTPLAPGAGAAAHFTSSPVDAESLRLSWTDAQGVAVLPLAGTLARARVATASEGTHWTATPAVAAAAEAWLGKPVVALGAAERALQATAAGWNFRQFALAPRSRGAGALRTAWRRLRDPALRPLRWGLAALVVVQLAGLNAWAWQERRDLAERRQAMVELLRSTYPQLRTVLDAPRQMARETEALRIAAGRPGEADLEPLLAVAAGVWPPGAPAASALQFERGRLSLGAPGWDAARVATARAALRDGWTLEYADGRLTLARTEAAAR